MKEAFMFQTMPFSSLISPFAGRNWHRTGYIPKRHRFREHPRLPWLHRACPSTTLDKRCCGKERKQCAHDMKKNLKCQVFPLLFVCTRRAKYVQILTTRTGIWYTFRLIDQPHAEEV